MQCCFRQSYEEESRKRRENAYAQDLICWDDVEETSTIQEINQLNADIHSNCLAHTLTFP